MEERGKFTLTSLEEVLDKHIGPAGSPQRTEFDKDVDDALDIYYMGQSIKNARKARALTPREIG